MTVDELEERHVLLWEAVSNITDQIRSLANHYVQEAGKSL